MLSFVPQTGSRVTWSAPSLLLLLAGLAPAQTYWSFGAAGPARADHALAYDPLRQRTVLFGGSDSSGATLFPHWEYDGTTWTRRTPAVTPPWSAEPAMVYDAARGHVVLFGGLFVGHAIDQTWTWDGTTWQRLTPPNRPPGQFGHSLLYDSTRQRVVLVDANLGGLWQWDGADWSQVPVGQAPPPRFDASVAYDAARDRIVVFGGITASTCLGETWEWDGTAWQQRFPSSSPSERWGAPMAYDEARQRVVLYGGRCTTNIALRDTWEWDGNDWERRRSEGSDLLEPRMAYDSTRARIVVHGGWRCPATAPCAEDGATWEYAPRWPASFIPFGTGCAGALGTPTLSELPGSLPWLGHTLELQLAPVSGPPAATFVIMGASTEFWGAIPLPLSLAVFGAPSCLFHTGAEVVLPVNTVGSVATWSLPIPNSPALRALSFFVQGVELGAPGIAVSNAGHVTVGEL